MRGFIYISTFLFILFLSLLPSRADAGSPAATVGSTTTHGGAIIGGSINVNIGGQPAARKTDQATCPQLKLVVPFPPTYLPHVGGPIISGSATVKINGLPAARVGGLIQEQLGEISTIATGSATVLIGN